MSSCRDRRLPKATPRVAKIIINDSRIICLFLLIFVNVYSFANPIIPIEPLKSLTNTDFNQSTTTVEALLSNNTSNSTENDLYVIRAVVYEIGILTDVDNSTNQTTERHEEVNLSFYDPPHKDNGLLDLSGIPVPKIVAPNNN